LQVRRLVGGRQAMQPVKKKKSPEGIFYFRFALFILPVSAV
jgi:hypothetical protein